MKLCPHCHFSENLDLNTNCKNCKQSLNAPPNPIRRPIQTYSGSPPPDSDNLGEAVQLTHRQLLGLAGSLLLFIGVFCPILTLPIVGSMNYFQNGRGDGVIVLVLAVISFFLAFQRLYKWLLWTGSGALAIMAFTFFNFYYRMSEVRSKMETDLAGNPFRGIGDAMLNSVQISWGWAILIIGAGCLIAAALWRRKRY